MMVSKKGATSGCGPEQAKNRLDVAKQYQELAHLKAKEKLAKHLSILIGDKTTSHYGEKFIGVETLKSCLRAMDQLISAATREVI